MDTPLAPSRPVFVLPAGPPARPDRRFLNRPDSPLMLADRLITMAQDADRAGYQPVAIQLVALVYALLDDQAGGCPAGLWGRAVGQPAGEPGQFGGADRVAGRAGQPQAQPQ